MLLISWELKASIVLQGEGKVIVTEVEPLANGLDAVDI